MTKAPTPLLALLAACTAAGCSDPPPAAPPDGDATPAEAADASPRLATWSGPPDGLGAFGRGRLAIIDGCVMLEGEGGPRAIAFPLGRVAWDAGKRVLVAWGREIPLGQQVTFAGGSVDTARAQAEPRYALNGCAPGSLLFIAERQIDE